MNIHEKTPDFHSINYSYLGLLKRLKKKLYLENKKLGKIDKLIIKTPKMLRDGTKKTIFTNFEETWEKLNRDKNHLISFISSELGTFVSLQDGGALVLKGKFHSRGIENILRNYIREFVLCGTCGCAETRLERNPENRLQFILCEYCGASRSVHPIKQGYMAQTRRKKK